MPVARLSPEDHLRVQRLAQETGQSQKEVISRALDSFERDRFFESIDAGYAAMQTDCAAWAAEKAEREAWDSTLADTGAE